MRPFVICLSSRHCSLSGCAYTQKRRGRCLNIEDLSPLLIYLMLLGSQLHSSILAFHKPQCFTCLRLIIQRSHPTLRKASRLLCMQMVRTNRSSNIPNPKLIARTSEARDMSGPLRCRGLSGVLESLRTDFRYDHCRRLYRFNSTCRQHAGG